MEGKHNRLPLVSLLGMVCAGAISWWSEQRYAGPYRWLIEGQDVLVGANFPFLTFMLVFFGLALPLSLLGALLPGPRLDVGGIVAHVRTYPRHAQSSLVAVLAIALGATSVIETLGIGPLQTCALLDVESGASTPAYVRLTSFEPDLDYAVTRSPIAIYVPLRSPRGGAPVVIAQFSEEALASLDTSAGVTGLLERDELPGDVRAAYEEADHLGTPHYLLRVGESPSSTMTFPAVLLSIGCVLGLLCGGYYFRVVRRP